MVGKPSPAKTAYYFSLGVDEAGMTHDDAAIGQPIEEAREQRREIRLLVEFIGAGEGRIGAQPERRGPAANPVAQEIEEQPLVVSQSLREGHRPPALAHPRIGRGARNDLEHGIANLREEMHMM